jgi:hypothetical protein
VALALIAFALGPTTGLLGTNFVKAQLEKQFAATVGGVSVQLQSGSLTIPSSEGSPAIQITNLLGRDLWVHVPRGNSHS